MGENRAGSGHKENKEIQLKIKKEFETDYDQLYQVWLVYNCKIANGLTELEAINEIEKENLEGWKKALKFFICYGLNVITFKMNKENL